MLFVLIVLLLFSTSQTVVYSYLYTTNCCIYFTV